MNNDIFSGGYTVIWFTLIVGIILQVVPQFSSFYIFTPHWLMLILAYWALALPHKVGMTTAFVMGILLDLFSGTVLGVHAFIFSVIIYLMTFRFQLIRNMALWQQAIFLFILSSLYNLLLFAFEAIIYHMITISPVIFLSSVVDSILWIGIFMLLRQIRRFFGID